MTSGLRSGGFAIDVTFTGDSILVAKSTAQRWIRLAVAMAAIAIVWLIVLPLIGKQPMVSEHIATQQRLQIDPSALFYSELEIAPAIARHVERLHDSFSDCFWSVSPSKDRTDAQLGTPHLRNARQQDRSQR